MATAPRCFNCGAPFLKTPFEEPVCSHCGAARPLRSPTQWGQPVPPPGAPRKASSRWVLIGIFAGLLTMTCTGAVALLLAAPLRSKPLPPPVARPTPPKEPVPAPPPAPPEPSVPSVVISEPTPAPAPAPKKLAPARPLTNEEWGAQRLAKQLKSYDYCGREAILRKQDIPRRYQLRAKFDANGEGMEGRVDPAPVAMLNACIKNKTKYIYLGKPPQPREFEVELALSFAHLRPKGEPETRDDQWDIDGMH